MEANFFFFAKMEDEDFILRDLSGKDGVQLKCFCLLPDRKENKGDETTLSRNDPSVANYNAVCMLI